MVPRAQAITRALAMCASANALAREAGDALDLDDDRLFSLLEQRDTMLSDVAEYVVTLRATRPTADSALFAAAAKSVDDTDVLIVELAEALRTSHRETMTLALRVEARTHLLREELAEVQRAGHAGLGYATPFLPHRIDRVR